MATTKSADSERGNIKVSRILVLAARYGIGIWPEASLPPANLSSMVPRSPTDGLVIDWRLSTLYIQDTHAPNSPDQAHLLNAVGLVHEIAHLLWVDPPHRMGDERGPFLGLEFMLLEHLGLLGQREKEMREYELEDQDEDEAYGFRNLPAKLQARVKKAGVYRKLSQRDRKSLRAWCMSQARQTGIRFRKGQHPEFPPNWGKLRAASFLANAQQDLNELASDVASRLNLKGT